MKKTALFFAAVLSIFVFTIAAYAAPTYSEWYFGKFGFYPDGTVSEWEYDPVYYDYLNQYDPDELNWLREGNRTEPFNDSGNGGDVDGDYAFVQDLYWNGRTAKWSVTGSASRYQVRLYRNGNRVSLNNNETTSRSFSFSSYMTSSGDYYFEVRPYCKASKSWGTWEQSDEEYFKGSGSSDPVSPSRPSGTANGWSAVPGGWQYYRNGSLVRNDWVLDGQFWYWFDGNGKMLTGWQWINRKCYYLNPNSAPNAAGFPYGACWMNGTTPDGYTVNASGAWTVNGVEQIR